LSISLLPSESPLQFLRPDGTLAENTPNLGLSSEELVDMYRTMVRTRTLDTLAISLQRQGQLGVWASSRGQEGGQVGCAFAMESRDWAFSTYREHAIAIHKGVPFDTLLRQYKGEWFGLFDPKEYGFAPHSIPIATHLLHAVGLAHAAKLAGDDLVVFGFVGDGATSEGDFHEALNFASVLDAPVVFFVQNNGFAISTPTRMQTRAPSLAHKAIGYGIQGYQVDGNDVLASYHTTRTAVTEARSTGRPALIEAHTYRMQPHTTADDDTRYRDTDEAKEWAAKDPILRLEKLLRSTGDLTDEIIETIASQANEESLSIRSQVTTAQAPPVAEGFNHVYENIPPHLALQRDAVLNEIQEAGL
jgi:2-oxoisovalerate dehydrogenase E1 component alpha subunit